MNYDKILRLKKYLLFVSIVLFVPLFSHLIYIYIYNDAKAEIVKGGQVSEAIIGNLPNLNPLKPLSGDNKYITSLLYRSLLKYDINEKKVKNDLANCDLTNLLYIKCDLESNIVWSNGQPITVKDVIATYKFYKNSEINPFMSSLLADTIIEEKNNSIIFSSKIKNIKLLDALFTPIVSESIINKVSLDDSKSPFSSKDNLYSGKYVFESTVNDNTDGITKLTLEKNEKYPNNDVNIDKIVFNFFIDLDDFLKHKESINLFNDSDNLVGNTIPRFKNNGFYLPQYISLFVNKDFIGDSNLRNYLLSKIDRENLLRILGKENFKEIKNPYLTDITIDKEPTDKNISKILSKLGYYKKSELLEKIISKTPKTSTGASSTGTLSSTVIATGSLVISSSTGTTYLKKSSIIVEPEFIDNYNFITKDDILLKGKAGSDITAVYVNDYKLNGYSSGKDYFYYRIRENVGNIKEGINKYDIYFEKSGNKQLVEEITFFYYKNKSELDKQKLIFEQSQNKSTTIDDSKLIEEKQKQLQVQLDIEKKLSLNKKKLEDENKEKLEKINLLDDKSFYNESLQKLSYNLVYVNSTRDMEITANYIKDSLTQEGIEINIKPLSMEGLTSLINKKDGGSDKGYDMILVPINLGNFDFNIFSYFHSSQVKSGYNFSNIKRLSLDILLEDLKGNFLQKDKIDDKEKQVLDILKEEQVVKVLYTPIINNLVDKNIKNYSIPDYIKDKSLRIQSLENAYILENKILDMKNKGVVGFIKFLINSLNE